MREESLTASFSRHVVFVDTDALPARESRAGRLVHNEGEAALVYQVTITLHILNRLLSEALQMVDTLEKCGLPQQEIGVIALYRQQIKSLNALLERKPEIEVLTADKSQGRDKECIIMSLTRSNEEGSVSYPLV